MVKSGGNSRPMGTGYNDVLVTIKSLTSNAPAKHIQGLVSHPFSLALQRDHIAPLCSMEL